MEIVCRNISNILPNLRILMLRIKDFIISSAKYCTLPPKKPYDFLFKIRVDHLDTCGHYSLDSLENSSLYLSSASSPLRRVQRNGAGYWKGVTRNLLSSKMSEKVQLWPKALNKYLKSGFFVCAISAHG